MAQKKKGGKAKKRKIRRPSAKNVAWQARSEDAKTGLLALIVLIGILAVAGGYYAQNHGLLALDSDRQAVESNTVRINEAMSENLSALVTESGDVPDWIEIANTGDEAVELGGYTLLLDDRFNRMYTFPEYSLQPDEYLILYAEGAENISEGGVLEPAL